MEFQDNITFTLAEPKDFDQIWELLKGSIAKRKADGSSQWQDGYPNETILASDIEKGWGFVLKEGEKVWAYMAAHINQEPAYNFIEGKWLQEGDFYVVHRVSVDMKAAGKGLGRRIVRDLEAYAKNQGIASVRMDTNYDNYSMLKILEQLGYTRTGIVYHRGEAREAFEKLL